MNQIKMKDLVVYLNSLINNVEYERARKIIFETLENLSTVDHKDKLFYQIELYGFLIDISSFTSNEKDLEVSIEFLINKEDEIKKQITAGSYYYNLANAIHEVNKIFYFKNRGVYSIDFCREKFQESIDLYWLAFKYNENNSGLQNEILINLSNSLMMNFRIVEALQMLDKVLKENPNFPQALISRGDNLNFLCSYTNSPVSISLYAQIFQSYNKGIQTEYLPPIILERSIGERERFVRKIQEHNFPIDKIMEELEINNVEYNQHSDYRKFCIDNFLTLNEHSLYCNCSLTSKDDIQIVLPNQVLQGKLIPKLELLLNRVKSEYAFARWNYYKSFTDNVFDYDVVFSDLFEDEVINSQSEAMRASYRICYGILDKIALGICKMYGVDGGNVYFETFWEDNKRKQVLEKQRNIHLNALSSIANDLNRKRGQLKHFKNWRNKIEHNLLILKGNQVTKYDVHDILADQEFIIVVDYDEFKEKTIQLLQLTRAAIFSFVYCIRLETITNDVHIKDHALRIGIKNQFLE